MQGPQKEHQQAASASPSKTCPALSQNNEEEK